jgi:hypothetical protein
MVGSGCLSYYYKDVESPGKFCPVVSREQETGFTAVGSSSHAETNAKGKFYS